MNTDGAQQVERKTPLSASLRISRQAPRVKRLTQAARILAKAGAMSPVGATKRDLENISIKQDLPAADILRLCGMLWELRLLYWKPSDVEYLTHDKMMGLASKSKSRPADTMDMIPEGFALRLS